MSERPGRIRRPGPGLLGGPGLVLLVAVAALAGCAPGPQLQEDAGRSRLAQQRPHPHAIWVKGKWAYQNGQYHWVKAHWKL